MSYFKEKVQIKKFWNYLMNIKMLNSDHNTVGILIPGQQGRATGILPQTNLTQNLPLVSNLPPENFSVKNPHLLRPPPALQGSAATGRRASDGGGAYFSLFTR